MTVYKSKVQKGKLVYVVRVDIDQTFRWVLRNVFDNVYAIELKQGHLGKQQGIRGKENPKHSVYVRRRALLSYHSHVVIDLQSTWPYPHYKFAAGLFLARVKLRGRRSGFSLPKLVEFDLHLFH